MVGEDGTDHESGRRGGHPPYTQWTPHEAGERFRKFVHPDRIAIHEEVAAARFAVLGEMHDRAGTVVDVNGRHPWPAPQTEHAAASHDRRDHAFPKHQPLPYTHPGNAVTIGSPATTYPSRRSRAGVRQRPQAEGRSGSSSVIERGPIAP